LILTKTKAELLLPRGRMVIATDTGEELGDVFKRMISANVLALPVLNQRNRYYGMVEMFDLVEYITTLFADVSNTTLIDLEKMLLSERKFIRATVKDVIRSPFSRNKSHKTLQSGFSLYTAWEVLALTGNSRIAVLGDSDEVVDIISPSMLVDFLWQNIERIGKLADRLVKDLLIPPSEVLATINQNARAIVAFREMVRLDKTGLGVVDESDRLVNNLSTRDLKGIQADAHVFWRLWSTSRI